MERNRWEAILITKMRLLGRDKDTICALATAHGLGAISVIRISGNQAAAITRKLAAFLPDHLESHKIYYGVLRKPESKQPLDEVLVSYFAEGRSFTGEESCEISCHGSEIIINDILAALLTSGARPAERGEFTYRAFMSGRMDLVQAESVLSLIESRSSRAARLAMRQLQGHLSQKLRSILDRLTVVLAHLEANIDFASEDIEISSHSELATVVQEELEQVNELLSGYREGRIVTSGFQIALVGAPNAGKSSLLNALAGEERAIVTPLPGTTRDFVETHISEAGINITVMDTAGLRRSDDPIEKIGIQRTLDKLQSVDLVLYVVDGAMGECSQDAEFWSRIPWDKTAIVYNKSDLGFKLQLPGEPMSLGVLNISALRGDGIQNLRTWLRERIRQEISEDSTVVSNARHFTGLQRVRESLVRATPLLLSGQSPDLIALELQEALKSLYEILGMTFDDQVMDRVFSEFCLGK